MELSPTITERIAGKKLAAELLEFVPEELDTDAMQDGFWKAIAEEAAKHLPAPEESKPLPSRPVMTDEESRRFEQKRIEYGQHEGERYYHVPIGYLLWIHESNESLGAYLRSERGQRRQDERS